MPLQNRVTPFGDIVATPQRGLFIACTEQATGREQRYDAVEKDVEILWIGDAEVKPGLSKLFTISPVNAQLPVDFRYKTANQKGCISPSVKKDFPYLYPISPGDSAQVYEMSPDKSADTAAWYVLRLKMKSGDTIFAARKGRVTEVQDRHGENDAGQTSIGTENYIEIAQPDCSFARYGILKKSSSSIMSSIA